MSAIALPGARSLGQLGPATVWNNAAAIARRAHPAGSGVAQGALPIQGLAAIAERLAATVVPASVPREAGTTRQYLRLFNTPSYDAWLISWGSTALLDLHDHGGSAGVVHVVKGQLVETYTDLKRGHPLRSRVVMAGGSLAVSATCVHEVWNPAAKEALSVHVYSPPLTAMTFYDHRPEHRLTPLHTKRGDLAAVEDTPAT